MDRTQLLYIHGGMTFLKHEDYLRYLRTREVILERPSFWTEVLEEQLGPDFQIIRPRMPLRENASYEDWKIHFERYIPLLDGEVILAGYSLGAIFLVQYLSENKFPKEIIALHLVAAPFDGNLPGEDLVGGFRLQSDLSLLQENCSHIHFWFSADDEVIPLSHAESYRQKLPGAQIDIIDGAQGHFRLEEFPAFVQAIKKDAGK
ncbi:MAG: alpha/beta hydrolase [Bacillota bacterium]